MSTNRTDVEDIVVGQSAHVPQEVCEALAPQSGHPTSSSCMPVSRTTLNLSSIELQVQFLITQADNLHKEIAKCEAKKDSGPWVIVLRTFIRACQPYFSFLESTARTKMLCPDDKLLEFSQELCDVLQRLVLDYASCNLLTLDETDPDNMSHFCIGQIELQRLRLSVTMFRYCKPTPYLARVNTGVFKRMRWNVERLDGGHEKYYYLCFEELPNMDADSDTFDPIVVQMWYIGQWVQVKPDPNTESIIDWVLCDVPEGAFDKLLFLGIQEPSSRTATDQFLKLLMSQEDISPQLDLRLSQQSGLEVAVLRSFAFACEPYFNFLESTARTMQLPPDMFVQLMEFSQEMCDTLEHLVLTFASNNLLTLDESEPDNMSHFCIGCIELDQLQLSVTAFRYCKPTPYLARINTGVFKRMRWNVKHLNGAKDEDGNPETDYYFLCYEDIPNLHTDNDNPDSKTVRMWSIGQWVQLKPDPKSETIFDWLECEVPEGAFEKLLFMGSQEPSSHTATDHLLQLLMSSVISVGNTSDVPRMV